MQRFLWEEVIERVEGQFASLALGREREGGREGERRREREREGD